MTATDTASVSVTEWRAVWMELPEPDDELRQRWAAAAERFARACTNWGYPAELVDDADAARENEVRFTDPESLPTSELLLRVAAICGVRDIIEQAVAE